jgi:hypothetical protein
MELSQMAGADMRSVSVRAILCSWLLLIGLPAQAANYLLIISGIEGDSSYGDAFYNWAGSMINAAQKRFGLPSDHIIYLADKPERDPELINGRSTKPDIAAAITSIAAQAQAEDSVFILLLGHGSTREDQAFFNISGPDLSAAEFGQLLKPLAAQKIAFIDTTAASGPFVRALSAPNRVIVTATATPAERYYTEFGHYFVAAFAEQGADINKDQRISVLEAFEYARREVQRSYETDNLMQSEHALLDDNADGDGSLEPDPALGDGALAHTLFFEASQLAGTTSTVSQDPALIMLLGDRQDIEQRIDALKQVKSELAAEDYYNQLEELLVELALKHREIRNQESD